MTKKEKILRMALELAIAEYELRLNNIYGVRGGKVDDHKPFAEQTAEIYIERAKEAK